MNPLFSSGDYAGGVIAGLGEITKLIQSPKTSQTASTSPVSTSVQTARGSGGWVVLVVVLAVVALLIGLIAFIFMRKKKADIQAARHKTLLAKQASASGINELIQATQLLEIKVNVTSGKIAPEDGAGLTDELEKAKTLVNQGSQKYSELSHSAGDPENPRLGMSELGALEPKYQKIVETLCQAREAVKKVENRISSIQQTIEGAAGKVSELNRRIEAVAASQEQVKSAGFKTRYSEELAVGARQNVSLAQSLFSQKRYNEGLQNLDQASRQIQPG